MTRLPSLNGLRFFLAAARAGSFSAAAEGRAALTGPWRRGYEGVLTALTEVGAQAAAMPFRRRSLSSL